MNFKQGTQMLLIVIILLVSGCGIIYHIKGRVVTMPGVSEGVVKEITGMPIPNEGTPIYNATVKMIFELDDQYMPVRGTTLFKAVQTDENGFFEIRDYVPINRKIIGLEIKKGGYKNKYATYVDKKGKIQVFLITLAQVE